MKQTKTKRRRTPPTTTLAFDGVYLFKMVLYVLIGSLWLKVDSGAALQLPLPLGFIVGIIFTTHEHFQIDRKIEYAVLLVAMLLGYFAPFGIYISLL